VQALYDVNALLATLDPDHKFHTRVRNWWARNVNLGWATCPLTQNGFVRIISQQGYPGRRPLYQAAESLRFAVAQPGHVFWPDDISLTDAALFDHSRILGPGQITDVYLLALAVKNGGQLVTFDRSIPIAAVRGAKPEHMVVPF
jgi:toxin-antitoxin system PIN domain toxin